MTREEINIKLSALCMYAPYKLKVKHDLQEFPCELQSIDVYRGSVECVPIGEKAFLGVQNFHVEFVKPILRSMDDMTDEEKRQYKEFENLTYFGKVAAWLCERKFDFMGLIPRGLAVDEKNIVL